MKNAADVSREIHCMHLSRLEKKVSAKSRRFFIEKMK